MKKVLIVILMALLLTGCQKPDEGRIRVIREGEHEIYIDTETGVCYLHTSYGGLCVMVDRNGNPYIANGWRDYSDGDDLY